MIFKSKKFADRLDVVDAMWDNILEEYVTVTEDTTWSEYAQACAGASRLRIREDVPSWFSEDAAQTWLWELTFLYSKPVRTMEHYYGDHAMLFDVFGCKEHKLIVKTFDDDRMVYHSTILCPICNEAVITPDKHYPLQYLVPSALTWERILATKKLYRKDVRKSNF